MCPDERLCIYVQADSRLKHYGDGDSLGAYQAPPVDYDLLVDLIVAELLPGARPHSQTVRNQASGREGGLSREDVVLDLV